MLGPIYDRGSGVDFTEKIIRAPGHGRPFFMHKTRGRIPERTLSEDGADSLEAMAMRTVLCNLAFINQEALRYIPAPIIQRIWHSVKRSSLDSIHAWQTFTLALPDDPPGQHKQRVPNPESYMDPYLSINSDTFAWLSVLTLCDVSYSYDELIKLGNVRNLSCVHVMSSRSTANGSIDDSIVRGWSRQAAQGAFPKLRMMVFRGQPHLTERCFEYLGAFQALTGVCVSTCGMDIASAVCVGHKHGWKWSRNGFRKYIEDRVGTSQYSVDVKDTWFSLTEDYMSGADGPQVHDSERELPVIVLSLGRESHNVGERVAAKHIKWFERCEKKPYVPEEAQEQEQKPNKKRKIRDTKRQDLGQMLGLS